MWITKSYGKRLPYYPKESRKNEVKGQEREKAQKSNHSCFEVDYSAFREYSKDELTKSLIKCIQCEQDYFSKIKSLKKTISNVSLEKECLEKSKVEAQIKIETLEIEKKEFQSKCEDLKK